jgi:hypothetical protein
MVVGQGFHKTRNSGIAENGALRQSDMITFCSYFSRTIICIQGKTVAVQLCENLGPVTASLST